MRGKRGIVRRRAQGKHANLQTTKANLHSGSEILEHARFALHIFSILNKAGKLRITKQFRAGLSSTAQEGEGPDGQEGKGRNHQHERI
jgi:hypothetical protein